MKFLVISKPNGQPHGLEASQDNAAGLQSLMADGTIEKAYALISGGSAVVFNANDTVELATKVRSHPLFKSSYTEVIPIADAEDFLATHYSLTQK